MGILIRMTFQVITWESAEFGEPEKAGWIDAEGTKYGFRELVELARCCEPSSSASSPGVWLTENGYSEDYITGSVEHRSYHPVSNRDKRYFVKAVRTAGLWGKGRAP